jgi:nitroreductase
MDILKAVKERRSIRDFQKKKIPDDLIDKLLEALIWAPRVSKKKQWRSLNENSCQYRWR